MVSKILGGCTHDWHILTQASGAPCVQDAWGKTHGALSISHSKERVACLFSPTPRKLGVDIEVKRPRADLRAILALICQTQELTWFDAAASNNQQTQRFFKLWTAKEAMVKAESLSLWQAQSTLKWTAFDENDIFPFKYMPLFIGHFKHTPSAHFGAWAIELKNTP